jgi:hypothetical protein
MRARPPALPQLSCARDVMSHRKDAAARSFLLK